MYASDLLLSWCPVYCRVARWAPCPHPPSSDTSAHGGTTTSCPCTKLPGEEGLHMQGPVTVHVHNMAGSQLMVPAAWVPLSEPQVWARPTGCPSEWALPHTTLQKG